MSKPSLSFVIPAKNEEESVTSLTNQIVKVVKKISTNYEIIFIDDGSTDKTFQTLKRIKKKNKKIKIIKHRGNFGKSIALQNGFNIARGDIIFTMDADLQDNPNEIPRFLEKLNQGYDLVSGWKKKRHDPFSKTFPSKVGNWATRAMTGIKIHDLNCGFKVYRKEVIQNMNLYGELYKYIPVLAMKQNFRIGEIIVKHIKRKYGKSKFGWERNIKGFLDMLTVAFLTGYIRKPGHFFGSLGIISFFFGFSIGLYIAYLRITTGGIEFHQPLLTFGMLLMVIGVQLISTGLLGEMITYTQQKIDYKYTIEKEL